jgi:TDG/mug DNA glycosylase family protein
MDDAATSPVPVRITGLPPVIGTSPGTLVLGSFPSVLSLCRREYYANPRNQFWRIIGQILGIDHRLPYAVRAARLGEHRVALWDVVHSCCRDGSADAAIRDPIFNDIAGLLDAHRTIRCMLLNGRAAGMYFSGLDLCLPEPVTVRVLPSTSPANARYPLSEKVKLWEIIRALQ